MTERILISPFLSELKFSFESYSECPYWRYNLWYDSWFNVIHLFIPRALPRGCLLRFSWLIFFHHIITNIVESPLGSYKFQTSTSDLISSSRLDVRWTLTGWTSTNVANLWFRNQECQRGMKDGCDWSSSFKTFTVSHNLNVKYFMKQYFNASPTTLHLLIKLYIIHAKFTFFSFFFFRSINVCLLAGSEMRKVRLLLQLLTPVFYNLWKRAIHTRTLIGSQDIWRIFVCSVTLETTQINKISIKFTVIMSRKVVFWHTDQQHGPEVRQPQICLEFVLFWALLTI